MREKNAHLWDRHPEDWYVEPEWVSKRLFEHEPFDGCIVDPACGLGRILIAAQSAGYRVVGRDIVNRSFYCMATKDFRDCHSSADNIVSNPPFGLCDPRGKPDECFVRHALNIANRKVALVLPTAWLNARKWLRGTGLYRVWLISPRPSMPPGPVIEAGESPGGGKKDFAWYVWLRGYDGEPSVRWLVRDEVPE